jgi:uncharacterized membrane protein
MVPLSIDSFSQALKYRESNNALRFITGFLFGIGLDFFTMGIIEFVRFLF